MFLLYKTDFQSLRLIAISWLVASPTYWDANNKEVRLFVLLYNSFLRHCKNCNKTINKKNTPSITVDQNKTKRNLTWVTWKPYKANCRSALLPRCRPLKGLLATVSLTLDGYLKLQLTCRVTIRLNPKDREPLKSGSQRTKSHKV